MKNVKQITSIYKINTNTMMAKILYKLYSIFMYPATVVTGIIAYLNLVKIYIEDIRNNDKAQLLSKTNLRLAAHQRIISNPEEVAEYIAFLKDRVGIIIYIIPIVFWIALYNLIF